jgi:phage gpG-like protein
MAEYPIQTTFEDQQIQNFFKNMKSRLKDVKDGEKKYAAILSVHVFADIIKHFNQQEGSDGPWKDWSPSYKKYMDRIGKGGNKILQWTGRLRNNFGRSSDEVSKKSLRVTNSNFTWFNNAKVGKKNFPYAAAHDNGGPILPKRDFMWLSDDAAEKMAKDTLSFILDEGI